MLEALLYIVLGYITLGGFYLAWIMDADKSRGNYRPSTMLVARAYLILIWPYVLGLSLIAVIKNRKG